MCGSDSLVLGLDASTLSGGYQQRLVISREFMGSGKIVVMRNPSQGLDQATLRNFLDLFWRRIDNGACAVVFTTDKREADILGNRKVSL
jgi:ABC-type uncharacterized transport system ATPase subunit